MVILGAKGHALEIVDVLLKNDPHESIILFDAITPVTDIPSFKAYPLLHSEEELADCFRKEKNFVLAVGNSYLRRKLALLGEKCGGRMVSVISASARISSLNVTLGEGLNIMHGVTIFPEVTLGEGTLINAGAQVHHQSRIGDYCEICPGAIITGNARIGNYTLVGAGAVILPGVTVGDHARIGAGAVVVKPVNDQETVAGNPARVIGKTDPPVI